MEYILSARKECSGAPVVVKTIVTSDLAFPVAEAYGARVVEVLTGFKYIGETIGRMEAEGEGSRFAFGFEESCGYLAGTHVRDKDGVMAVMLVAEMAQAYAARGISLAKAMDDLYAIYGTMGTRLLNFEVGGAHPMSDMSALMKKLRAQPLALLGDEPVQCVRDYLSGVDELPASDVLSCQNAWGGKAIVRPSGTEPKVKVYLSAKGESPEDARVRLDRMEQEVESWLGMTQEAGVRSGVK
jgi:phosphoglucomutase